jgi:hypothetical protein
LAQDSLEVALANTLGSHLRSEDPCAHIYVSTDKRSYACRGP